MSNVNHRYSSQSWTLDSSAQQSPLSRWTKRDILRKESFRLSLLGAESGVAPVVWLTGDRPCFEQLYQTIESYVQKGLSQPVLAPQSAFPVASSPEEAEEKSSEMAPSSNSLGGQTASTTEPLKSHTSRKGDFSIEALGLLRHQLTYQGNDSPRRQMQLSTLQLADLLDVLDQWQKQTSALPERQAGLNQAGLSSTAGDSENPEHTLLTNSPRTGSPARKEFVIPQWGRVAASVAIATGVAGIGVYSILQGGPAQIAMETAQTPNETPISPTASDFATGNSSTPTISSPGGLFSSFPSAEGPPITTQAQSGLALPDPLVTPPSGAILPPPVPSVVFPTSGELAPGLLSSSGSDTSSDSSSTAESSVLSEGSSTTSIDLAGNGDTADSNTSLTTSDGLIDNSQPSPFSTATTNDGLIDNSQPSPFSTATTNDGLIDNSQPTSITSTTSNGQFLNNDRLINGGAVNPEDAAGFSGSSAIAQETRLEDASAEDIPLVSPSSAPVNPNDLSLPIDPNTQTNLSLPADTSTAAKTSPTATAQGNSAAANEVIVATTPSLDEAPPSSASVLSEASPSSPIASGAESGLQEDSETAFSTSPPVAIASPTQTGTSSSGASRARPDSSSTPVTEPLPTNSQSMAVESYLQSNWTPPFVQKQLQYRISVSSEGKLTAVQPLPGTVKSPDFPKVGSTITGASSSVQSTLNVTVTPLGRVIVTVERETPAQ